MTEDLSHYHAPLTRLFPAPAARAEWEQYRLTGEQVAFYEEAGLALTIRRARTAASATCRAATAGPTCP